MLCACREAAAAAAAVNPEPPAAADGSDKDAKQDSKAAEASGTPAPAAGPTASATAAAGICPPTPAPSPAASAADIADPEYGAVAWVLNSSLVLIGSRALSYGELKKHMLQSIIIIITATGAKYNEPVLFMRIMVSWLQTRGAVTEILAVPCCEMLRRPLMVT